MAIDKNLVQRSLAGLVFLAVMVSCICYNRVSLISVFMLIAFVGLIEFSGLIHKKINLGKGYFLIIGFQSLICLFLFLMMFGCIQVHYITPVLLSILVISAATLFVTGCTIEQRIALVGTYVFSIIYILIPFILLSSTSWIRLYDSFNIIVLYFFILIWVNDTMAYVTGRLFGKHKLAESISPKKTVEGFIGGIVFTTVISVVLGVFYPTWFGNPIIFWIAPILVGVFGTLGDLFESAIKRWVGVKDSGNLIPGHGGILDRFDGALIAVWPYSILLILLNR